MTSPTKESLKDHVKSQGPALRTQAFIVVEAMTGESLKDKCSAACEQLGLTLELVSGPAADSWRAGSLKGKVISVPKIEEVCDLFSFCRLVCRVMQVETKRKLDSASSSLEEDLFAMLVCLKLQLAPAKELKDVVSGNPEAGHLL